MDVEEKRKRANELIRAAGGLEAVQRFQVLKLSQEKRKELWRLLKQIKLAERRVGKSK